MEGTTGQKWRPNQMKGNKPGPSCGPRRPLASAQVSILSDPNGAPGSGTINKERMEQFQFGILINALLQRILEASDPVWVERSR